MFSTAIDRDRDLTVHTAQGTVTAPLLITYLREGGREGLTRSVLWDLTKADLAGFGERDIRSLFRILGQLAEARRGGKTALVFSRPVDFGVGRMIEAYSESLEFPFRFKSFWDLEAAEAWLFAGRQDWGGGKG